MRPRSWASPRTCAAFTVIAASASSGARWSCVQASEQTSGRLVVNALPGLKSVASAIAAPASTSARAGGIGRSRNSALAGSSTPVTSLAASGRDAVRARRLEVVDASRAELDGERDRAALRELVAVQAQREPRVAARGQVAACLRGVERATLEEDVRRVRKLRRLRQHLGQARSRDTRRVSRLGRHRVRAEPGRRAARSAHSAQRRELGRRGRGRSRTSPPTSSCRGASIQPAWRSTRLSSSGAPSARVAATVERMPPPAACSSS